MQQINHTPITPLGNLPPFFFNTVNLKESPTVESDDGPTEGCPSPHREHLPWMGTSTEWQMSETNSTGLKTECYPPNESGRTP